MAKESKEIHPKYIKDYDLPEPNPDSPYSQFLFGPIDGRRIVKRSLTLSQLNFVPLESVGKKEDIVATINASSEGLRIASSLIKIDGSVVFSSGYDPTEKVDELGGQYDSAASGARVRIFPDVNTGIQVIDDAGKDVLKAVVGGTNVGDVVIGDYATTNGAKWDKSAGTFKIKGTLELVSGYSNISDKPGQLGDINSTEGNKLTGIESGADVTGTHIAAGISGQGALATLNQVTTTEIADNSISTPKLQANAVTANEINVSQLSAISADVGLLTAGTLRGVQVETAASGQRIILYSTLMAFYNTSGENVASIYAGASDLLIKNQLTTKNIFIDAGSGGYVTLGTGGTIKMQVGASTIECRQSISPYSTDFYALGLATKRWTNLYLQNTGKIYFGGSYALTGTVQSYGGNYAIQLTGLADTLPSVSGVWELGSSSYKWYNLHLSNHIYIDNDIYPNSDNSSSSLGFSSRYFNQLYSYFVRYKDLGAFQKHDDIALMKKIKAKKIKAPGVNKLNAKGEKVKGKEQEIEIWDGGTMPKEVYQEGFYNAGAVNGLLIGAVKQLIEKVENLEQKVELK